MNLMHLELMKKLYCLKTLLEALIGEEDDGGWTPLFAVAARQGELFDRTNNRKKGYIRSHKSGKEQRERKCCDRCSKRTTSLSLHIKFVFAPFKLGGLNKTSSQQVL